MAYNHFAFFPKGSELTFNQIIQSIKEIYSNSANISFSQQGKDYLDCDYLIIQFPKNYQITLCWRDDNSAKLEAQGIVESGYFETDYSCEPLTSEKLAILAQSEKYIDFSADDDVDMEYFNEMLFILDKLENIGQAIIISLD